MTIHQKRDLALADYVWAKMELGCGFMDVVKDIWWRMDVWWDKESVAKKIKEITKINDETERLRNAASWLKGTVDMTIMAAYKLGQKDNYRKYGWKLFRQSFCMELLRLKKDFEQRNIDWQPEVNRRVEEMAEQLGLITETVKRAKIDYAEVNW